MALIVAFAIVCVLTPIMARVATRLGVVDRPGPLKVQDRAVPYLGGVAVFVAVAVVVAPERPSTLVPLALALALGLLDDLLDLGVRVRLVGELIIAAATVAVVPVRGPVGALVTIVFVVVLLNAVNLLDGLDGLAGGVTVASAVGFAAALGGSWTVLALALGGAVLGFLVWNRPPARIYLGDAGSYLIGTTLAVLLASAFGRGEPAAVGAGALLFVGVPVLDTSVAIIRRARARRPLFAGDRSHVYDQLVDRGWRAPVVTLVCIGVQAGLVAIGIAATAMAAGAAVAVVAIVVVLVAVLAMRTFTAPGSWSS